MLKKRSQKRRKEKLWSFEISNRVLHQANRLLQGEHHLRLAFSRQAIYTGNAEAKPLVAPSASTQIRFNRWKNIGHFSVGNIKGTPAKRINLAGVTP